MGKKIIFIGPPGAGKTTLRKVFFEGESSSNLLDYALEPTHGKESVILQLNEDVGVFDLAGQENTRWFETDDKEIFYDTKILIVVIDITTDHEKILEFIRKVIKIRNEITPTAIIYILIHKIDLVAQKTIKTLKYKISDVIGEEKLVKIAFTSIQKIFFPSTFSLFMDILDICISERGTPKRIDLDLLQNIIDFLYELQKSVLISKNDLQIRLKAPDEIIDSISKLLSNKGHIDISKINDRTIFSLTDKGKNYFKEILDKFSLQKLIKFDKEDYKTESALGPKIPPYLGFLVADKDGKTMINTEVFDGAFDLFLNAEEGAMKTDFELIPMFISALEKFSEEININDLAGFQLKGTNIEMQTLSFELYTVTLFINPKTNVKFFEDLIREWFENLFELHRKELESAIETGYMSRVYKLNQEGREWLENLNQRYKDMAINLEIFDFDQAKVLYHHIDDISSDINFKYTLVLQKIKKLKMDLMKAILVEDFLEVKEIAGKIREITV